MNWSRLYICTYVCCPTRSKWKIKLTNLVSCTVDIVVYIRKCVACICLTSLIPIVFGSGTVSLNRPFCMLYSVAVLSGCTQWLYSVAVVSDCSQWLYSVAVFSGSFQWLYSVAVVSGCTQWLYSVAVFSWLFSVAVLSGCTQWLYSLTGCIDLQTTKDSWVNCLSVHPILTALWCN